MKLMFRKINNFTNSHPRIFVFCLAFFYVVLAGIFIQLLFLPHLAPHGISVRKGLLSGYDSPKFHLIAENASTMIREYGWSFWKIKPEGQIISGIASIFYALFTPEPWVLLPLNGIMHGIASLALFETLSVICDNRKLALFSSFPFILFPSSLLWNAQIHNEIFVIPGVMLILFGWVSLADKYHVMKFIKSFMAFFCIIIGSFIVWAIRDQIMTIIHLCELLAILLIICYGAIQLIRKSIRFSNLFVHIGLLTLIWLIGSPDLFNKIDMGYIYSSKSDDSSFTSGLESDITDQSKIRVTWVKTAWLPDEIDNNMHTLSNIRYKFIKYWSDSGSQIDTEVVFGQALDIITYFPRAMEVSFLAPFPVDWLASGYKKGGDLMRKESGFEMIIVYICLIGLLYSAWHFRTKVEIWILATLTVGMLFVYSCAIPNVGALYRFRYPYLMPLVCLGLAGVILIFQKYMKTTKPE